jgi:4-hydroxybenzoate polyprenyltransferase
MVKFSHTIFAMPFALVGYFLALELEHISFDSFLLLKIVACMVFARNAAMAFNRYADREFDKQNPRTFFREIPSGVISPKSALIFVFLNTILFTITTYTINDLCFYLSPVAMVIVLGYSYTKRFTPFCHLILGAGLSLAPLGAYMAATGHFALVPALFSISVLFWVSGFDIIYSLQDTDFDSKFNLRSIPVYLGKKNALLLSRCFHLLAAVCLFLPGILDQGGIYYFIGWGIFSSMLVYQHSLVKVDDLSKVNIAFFTTNGIASILFVTFFLLDYYTLFA